jgi:hypothetical protein
MQAPPALAEGQGAQISTIEPEKVEGHIGGLPRSAHEVVKKRPPGLVGRDHLSIKNDTIDVELGSYRLAERVEAGQGVSVPGDKSAPCPSLDIQQGPKTVVLELEEPLGIVRMDPSWKWG